MKISNYLLQPFVYLVFFLLTVIVVFPVSLIALPFPRVVKFKMTQPFWHIFFRLSVRLVLLAKVSKIDRRDKESIAKISPQGLYIANHQSFADIPLLFSTIIIPPIMKQSVVWIPIFGVCAFSAGGILVNRSNRDSRKQVFEEAKERLRNDYKHLHYFPEGTRNKDSIYPKPFDEIKIALMQFAFEENIPVYPVSLFGTSDVLDNSFIQPGKHLGILFHESVRPEDFKEEKDFLEACWSKVVSGVHELEGKITRE